MPDRVLIVGAGPTGLTAALALSRLGIAVRIIDKQAAPPTTSRAVGVQARTLELLELRGLADEMVRLGNPGLAASFYGGGKHVFRLDFTRIDCRYHYLLFISQAETERILRTAVEKQGVRIERGVELVGLAQDMLSPEPSPVRVVLRHADGQLEQAQAPWLISAEGAHSTVRAGVFAADYRVVAIDQAGHSETGKGRKAWTADSLAGNVEAVVKELGLKRVILVGHSMAGWVALLAARRMPGTVVAVIGVDTLQNAEFKLPEEVRKPILDGVQKDFNGAVRTMFDGQFPEKADPEVKERVQTKAEGQDSKMAFALMHDLIGFDTRKLLKEAKVPVRCINSAGGYKSFTPTVVETNKKYADFGAVTIDGVGHYPMLEKPDEFNRKLRDVLKEFAPGK
jgi:pimeloyl-ACP methyl ester carboxylesterase